MPKRNTYSYLIEVLQYTIANEHAHFVEAFCKDGSPESIEDAFDDHTVEHVYKSAKLAHRELLNNVTEIKRPEPVKCNKCNGIIRQERQGEPMQCNSCGSYGESIF